MGHGWKATEAFGLPVLRQVTSATPLQEVLLAFLLNVPLFRKAVWMSQGCDFPFWIIWTPETLLLFPFFQWLSWGNA